MIQRVRRHAPQSTAAGIFEGSGRACPDLSRSLLPRSPKMGYTVFAKINPPNGTHHPRRHLGDFCFCCPPSWPDATRFCRNPSPLRHCQPPSGQYDPTAVGAIFGRVTWDGPIPSFPLVTVPIFSPSGVEFRHYPHPNVPDIDLSTREVGGAIVYLEGVDPSRPSRGITTRRASRFSKIAWSSFREMSKSAPASSAAAIPSKWCRRIRDCAFSRPAERHSLGWPFPTPTAHYGEH